MRRVAAVAVVFLVGLSVVGLMVALPRDRDVATSGQTPDSATDQALGPKQQSGQGVQDVRNSDPSALGAGLSEQPQEELLREAQPEETVAAVEERLVEEFEAETDRWLKPAKDGVPVAAVENFTRVFKKVPPERRSESLHRALNVLPDANVMLLAGILTDRSLPTEVVKEVFSDILNRSDDVKKPILQEIFKDKDHPCWAETAWILDATGELPSRGEK